MAVTESRAFRQMVADMFARNNTMDLDADQINGALFGNGITPDRDVSAANSAFNAGQWLTSNEITSSTSWPSEGATLTSKVISTPSSGIIQFSAANLVSPGTNCTMSNIYCVYTFDKTLTTPVAKQGVAYTYFGGAQNVVTGQFTVIWSANGVFRVAV